MEIITMVLLVVLTALPLYLVSSRLTKILFGLVLLTVGLFVQIGGITVTPLLHNTTTYTLVQTNTTASFILFLFLTFGSVLAMYTAGTDGGDSDE